MFKKNLEIPIFNTIKETINVAEQNTTNSNNKNIVVFNATNFYTEDITPKTTCKTEEKTNKYKITYTGNSNQYDNNQNEDYSITTFDINSQDGKTYKINVSVDKDIKGDCLKELATALKNMPNDIIDIMIKENIENITISEPKYIFANGTKKTDTQTQAEYFGDTNSIILQAKIITTK